MKITPEDLAQWRTGLHAANPEQAKALVEMLDETTKARDDYRGWWIKEEEKRKTIARDAGKRMDELEQQVAVLREACGKLLHWHDWGRRGEGMVVSAEAVRGIWAALSTTQPSGWVRLADVERVMRPLLPSAEHAAPFELDHDAVRAARAWLDGVREP